MFTFLVLAYKRFTGFLDRHDDQLFNYFLLFVETVTIYFDDHEESLKYM